MARRRAEPAPGASAGSAAAAASAAPLAGAGGIAVGRIAAGPPRRRAPAASARRDVVVVGAGLAGLSAARGRSPAPASSVVVLEARDRVGGRTLNREIGGGEMVEIGGQWVGPTQDRVLALIDELGLKTFDTYIDGKNVYYRDGTRTALHGADPARRRRRRWSRC